MAIHEIDRQLREEQIQEKEWRELFPEYLHNKLRLGIVKNVWKNKFQYVCSEVTSANIHIKLKRKSDGILVLAAFYPNEGGVDHNLDIILERNSFFSRKRISILAFAEKYVEESSYPLERKEKDYIDSLIEKVVADFNKYASTFLNGKYEEFNSAYSRLSEIEKKKYSWI
jgi:hypothetical protein